MNTTWCICGPSEHVIDVQNRAGTLHSGTPTGLASGKSRSVFSPHRKSLPEPPGYKLYISIKVIEFFYYARGCYLSVDLILSESDVAFLAARPVSEIVLVAISSGFLLCSLFPVVHARHFPPARVCINARILGWMSGSGKFRRNFVRAARLQSFLIFSLQMPFRNQS